MLIPKYLLKILAIEINNSQNSNHFSFSANHIVLIPLSTLKQPPIGIKSFIWDRDATGISTADWSLASDSIANYYYTQFQLISFHLQKLHTDTETFGRGRFVFL